MFILRKSALFMAVAVIGVVYFVDIPIISSLSDDAAATNEKSTTEESTTDTNTNNIEASSTPISAFTQTNEQVAIIKEKTQQTAVREEKTQQTNKKVSVGGNNITNPRPIILVGTHHKTGVVLTRDLFKSIAKSAKLKYERFQHTSIDRSKLAERMKDLDIVVTRQWELVEEDLKAIGRPYKFVHFTRHPMDIITSAYSYHLKRSERWLRRDEKLVREDWCGGGETPAKETIKRCEKFGKQLPFLCEEEGRAAFENLLCHEYDLMKEEEQSTNSKSSWRTTHWDALKRRNRLDGVRMEAARTKGIRQQLAMAAVIEDTKNDPNVLNVNLDTVVTNHAKCWTKILSFVGLDPSKYLSQTNRFAITATKQSGTHITRNENKTDIKQEVRTNPYVQKAYGPLVRIMEEAHPELSCD